MKVVVAIILGGFVAGALDITSAFVTYVPHGATEIGILHFVASGLIGKAAMNGGLATAVLGLCVHFGLTTLMAALFVTASLWFEGLRRAPWISGIVYGLVVYAVMTYVAVPLSAVASWTPASGWAMVGGILVHCTYVGLPIALIARQVIGDSAPRSAKLV